MSSTVVPLKPPSGKNPHEPATPAGPLDWRKLVEWLSADNVITAQEAQRTIARCSQAESAQHALVRLASVAMERASDG